VSPSNMEPTIHTNDIVALNQSAYRRANPQRWDVIAFSLPTNTGLHVSRIWGLPGEIINLTNGTVQINGTNVSLPSDLLSVIKLRDLFPSNAVAMIQFPYQVSNTGFFVMGDNLRNSYDSRFWGEVASNRIAGRISIIK
jgi:signal peptidase I